MKISTTKQTQGAMPKLDRAEKTVYWLIIGEGEDKYALNVGKKSYEEVNKLIGKEAEKEKEKDENQTEINEFQNVSVYPLVAEILGLKISEPIDGKLSEVKKALK